MSEPVTPWHSTAMRWWPGLAVILACAAALSLGYAVRQRTKADQVSLENQLLSTNVSQMRTQLDTLSSTVGELATRLNALGAQTHVTERRLNSDSGQHNRRALKRLDALRRQREDSRWKNMQARLEDQQTKIANTRDDLAKTRSEFESSLKASHGELSGSIARNHDELVALEKRGERSYFEFDLLKTSGFQRIGPLSLCLRKTNVKHQRYNADFIVGDNKLGKKDMSLYEPVFFYPEGTHQVLELVINRIEKDAIHGYVSAPKYPEPDLTAAVIPGNAGTPLNSRDSHSDGDKISGPKNARTDARIGNTLARRPDGSEL